MLESQRRCYCGVEESMLATQKDKKKRKLTIDRMDNDIAYRKSVFSLFSMQPLQERFFHLRSMERHR